jgi:hypothetical protein
MLPRVVSIQYISCCSAASAQLFNAANPRRQQQQQQRQQYHQYLMEDSAAPNRRAACSLQHFSGSDWSTELKSRSGAAQQRFVVRHQRRRAPVVDGFRSFPCGTHILGSCMFERSTGASSRIQTDANAVRSSSVLPLPTTLRCGPLLPAWQGSGSGLVHRRSGSI